MPVYSIQVPDGRTLDIEAADENTAINGAKQWYSVNAMSKEESEARKTLKEIGEEGDGSKVKTFVKEAANTALLNIPRNLEAGVDYVWDMVDGGDSKGFADHYDRIKKVDEARATLNPWSAGLGTGLGIAGPIAATFLSGGTATPVTAPALAGAGARLLPRIAAGATVGAVGSGVDEFLDQGIVSNNRDWNKVGAATALGGVVGGAAVPAADLVGKGVGKVSDMLSARKPINAADVLTPENIAKLKAAGLDPNSFGPEALEAVSRKGVSEPTIRELQAKNFGIDLTKGQALGNFDEMRFEHVASQGGYGNKKASNILAPFLDQQNDQITAAKDAIGRKFAGKVDDTGNLVNAVDDPLSAADNVISEIRNKAQNAKQEYRDLYSNALGRDGEFVGSSFDGLGTKIQKGLEGNVEIDSMLTPGANRAIKILDDLRAPKAADDVIGNVSLREAEQVRKRLNAVRAAATSPEDRRAVSTIIDRFDNHLEDSMANSLFSGDEGALDALRKARASYAKYQQTFKAKKGDDASRWMQRIVETDVTAKEVSDALFGLSRIGEKGVSQRLAVKLQSTLGKDSDAWKGIRQGVWQKIVSKPEGKDDWGVQAMSERISSFLTDGQALAKVVYSPEELAVMKEFSSVLKTIRGPKIGGKTANPNSDTAAAVGGMLSKVMNKYETIFSGLGLLVDGATGGLGGMVLSQAVRGAKTMGREAIQGAKAKAAIRGAPTMIENRAPRLTKPKTIVSMTPGMAFSGGLLADDLGY